MLIGRYPALLDANVLHPAFLRGAILWFADERLLQPCWSQDILAEWRASLLKRFPDTPLEKLDLQEQQMQEAFPDAMISGYSAITGALDLPDSKDQHVLAAAIVGKCSGIVTANTKHFPAEAVTPYSIEVIHPDDFIVNVIDLDQGRALEACRRHRAAMSQSQISAEDFLRRYEAAGLIQAHQRLKPHVGLI